jgi:formate dehydrogenase subunit gamma
VSEPTLIEPGDAILPGKPPRVVRYPKAARINHWIGAVAMILLIVSGLGMFHPSLFFLTSLFGGGQIARTLHPWFGVVLSASFFFLFLRFWRGNLPKKEDAVWAAHIGDLVQGHHEKMPEVGKYNAGQKVVFWGISIIIPVMLFTGVMVWDQYFSGLAPIPVQRIALIVHAVAAVIAILIILMHVYAAIWIRGSFDAMTKGHVSAGWAWRHHPKWLRRLAEQSRQNGSTKKSA